jgi:hypothetical protein
MLLVFAFITRQRGKRSKKNGEISRWLPNRKFEMAITSKIGVPPPTIF